MFPPPEGGGNLNSPAPSILRDACYHDNRGSPTHIYVEGKQSLPDNLHVLSLLLLEPNSFD